MLSSTNQISRISATTICASFLRNIQNWVRYEFLAADSSDDVTYEEALLSALMEQEQISHHQSPSTDRDIDQNLWF